MTLEEHMARTLNLSLAVLAALAAGLAWIPAVVRADGAAEASPPCHAAAPSLKRATRTTADYVVPEVALVRDDGKRVSFPAEIDDGEAVVLNFIFTTCTTICPVTSQVFSQLQGRLGDRMGKVHLVSISIDPEQDTPDRLVAYARRFHAGPHWHHYTRTVEASVALQRAFDAYRGDKMSHLPVTFLRAAPGRPWVRIDGFASAAELANEFQTLVASH
jgi:protein SCO1/2